MIEHQIQSDIGNSHVNKIIKDHSLNVFCVYLGCMMKDLISCFMGNTTLSQLKLVAIDYFLPCAVILCVCIGFSLIKHKHR